MLKLAIIGCGRISYKHIQAAVDHQHSLKLVSVCDIVEERAEHRANLYQSSVRGDLKPKVYTNYMDMIRFEEIDLVSICTESGYHAEQAIYCIRQGKHVIVEKPMALSNSDADLMITAAKENNVKLCVCHQNRFNLPIQKLREAIEEGRFGKIIAGNARILWNRGQDYYDQAPWRGTYALDGGCLMNQCIHNIDLLQWMLGGRISWLNSDVSNMIHPYIEAEDYGSIQIKFDNGAVGNVEGTICVYPQNLEETLTIIGENGIVSIGGVAVNKIETWRFKDGKDTEEDLMKICNREVDTVYGSGHTPLYQDVIESVITDRQPYISGSEGKKAMEIILAAYKSSRDGQRVQFPIKPVASTDFKQEA